MKLKELCRQKMKDHEQRNGMATGLSEHRGGLAAATETGNVAAEGAEKPLRR